MNTRLSYLHHVGINPNTKGARKRLGLIVKTKNIPWTAEEEAILVEAVRDNVSPTRLAVRLQRSVHAVKRRMRELGLAGQRHGPGRASKSAIRFSLDPLLQIERWLEACKSGDIDSCLKYYAVEATLECACSGPAVYAGRAAIQEYWVQKLRSNAPGRFSLVRTSQESERFVIDYLSFEAKPVRMYVSFDETGAIVHSKCGPHIRNQAHALTH
jgi:hypothetical protein